jgi:carbonic anhydrase/acetyltransferase-like protein (isoleucine patch superfamily)
MYNPEVPFSTDEYILTSTRNVISRSSTIHMPSSLEIPLGRCFIAHGVTIRADLAPVQIQKYTFVGEGSTLQPCHMLNDFSKFIPLTVGSHCSIGKRCTVEAAVMGMGCTIGDDCILSQR